MVLDLLSSKSPGRDGFNVEFFRSFWDDIGDHLFLQLNIFLLILLCLLPGVRPSFLLFLRKRILLWFLIFALSPFVMFAIRLSPNF